MGSRSRRNLVALDLVICVVLLAPSVPFTLSSEELGAGTDLDTVLLPAVVLPILLRRRAPLVAAAAFAAGCVLSGVPTFEQFRILSALPAGALILYGIAIREERARALGGLALVFGGLLFVGLTEALGDDDGGGIGVVLWAFPLCIAVWLGGSFIRSRERLAAELAERSELLMHRREQTSQLAVEVERTLLESEIDAATRASVQEMIELADSGEQALSGNLERSRYAFARVEQLARETLNAMRGLLGVLRNDERAGTAVSPAQVPQSSDTPSVEADGADPPPAREQRRVHPADVALAAALAALLLVDVFTKGDVSRPVWAVIAVLLLAAPIAFRRAHAIAAMYFSAAMGIAAPAVVSEDTAVLAAIICYSCGAYASRRAGLLAVAAANVAGWIEIGVEGFWSVILVALWTIPPWWVGRQLRSRRELVRALAERNRDLEAAEEELSRLSVRRERARVAHELHDVVGHQLAVIAVQAQAGGVLVDADRSAAAKGFAAIRGCGETALAELTRLVDILDTESDKGLGSIEVLVKQASAAGLDLRMAPLPAGVALPAEVEQAAYRVVQEALTNAIKHAPGAEVDVRLRVEGSELEVTVSDGGAASSSPLGITGSGMGLPGMTDRVASLGGSVDSGPRESGGWRVFARLPVSPTKEAVDGSDPRGRSRTP